jgi:hypothetical protein
MNISKSTFELLQPIIDLIDKSVIIQSVTEIDPGKKYKLFLCDTKWATQGFPTTIQGNQYKIIALDPNVSITVSGTVLPTIGSFNLYAPKFLHGTIKVAEEGLNKKASNGSLLSIDKMPLIWLHEPIDERISYDDENPIYRFSNCDIYFLVDANISKWEQDDHYKQAIKPVRQLISGFMDAMMKSGLINDNELGDIKIMDLPRFGRYTADNGASKAVFAEYELSGTKLNIEIPFIRNSKNCC